MNKYILQNKTVTTIIMSKYRAKKSMSVLLRLKQQQSPKENSHPNNETPINTDNEDDDNDNCATILVNNHKEEDDLYTPLSPEEADEDQLAEFFTNCDRLLFEEEEYLQDDAAIKERSSQKLDFAYILSKRKRLSSCSLTSFMNPGNNNDDNKVSLLKSKRYRLQAKSTSGSPKE
mmetsp:Transcript_56234/g.62888  ORF Transcript_56234/g.62888 Transcript_56234/m.62888 type:complete len:175 (+) Transcript_56234:129-653(+)